MSTRVVEQVDDWDEQSFSGGYRGLHDLADGDFSGVVRAGGAELFMTKGVVVGIRHGTIETFEDASGTQYVAPTPALPLLAVMQDRSDEVRAQYYTEKTSISEVNRTLEDGGFTGYVELSENVLSGDYYLVYHRGRSMSVAYVGNQQRLIEGDEAFEQADGEVGIYEVRPVDIDAIEIPEVEDEESEPTAGMAAEVDDESDEPAGEPEADVEDDDSEEEVTVEDDDGTDPVETEAEPTAAATDASDDTLEERTPSQTESSQPESPEQTVDKGGGAQTGEAASQRHEEATEDGRRTAGESSTPDTAGGETAETHAETTETAQTGSVESQPSEPASERASNGGTQRAPQTEPVPADRDSGRERTETPTTSAETQTGAQSTEQQPNQQTTEVVSETERSSPESPSDLETRAIPSLDPELTESVDRAGGGSNRADAPGRSDRDTGRSAGASASETDQRQSTPAEPRTETSTPAEQSQEPAESTEETHEKEVEQATEAETAVEDETATSGETTERIEELEVQLEERRERITQLESELGRVETERDDARAKLATVQEERDELEEQVERLESELRRLEEELGAATDAQRRITPQEALDGTDLFVRYHSKGDGTLEKAHDSGIRREDFTENLRLEKHTQFEAAGTAVGGQTYDEFLEDTVEYKFVQWVVRDLLFEIQSTGHTETLSDLYDALPKINRVELNGAVTATDEEGNETTETFDIVFRARMGEPLLVANINDSRQGATEGMMETLITAAERVGKTTDDFASAFLVTQSFFEPAALETVAGATRGGLLSRDKRKSFVNLSRKQGYHLCLVEARNENFHLEVPEL